MCDRSTRIWVKLLFDSVDEVSEVLLLLVRMQRVSTNQEAVILHAQWLEELHVDLQLLQEPIALPACGENICLHMVLVFSRAQETLSWVEHWPNRCGEYNRYQCGDQYLLSGVQGSQIGALTKKMFWRMQFSAKQCSTGGIVGETWQSWALSIDFSFWIWTSSPKSRNKFE